MRLLWGMIPIDDIVLLGERHPFSCADFVANQHKHERARPAFLVRHIHDSRCALDLLSNPQRVMELQTSTRPHAARQGHRRKKTAPRRVAVGSSSDWR